MAMEEKNLLKELKAKFPSEILEISVSFGDETIVIKKEALLNILCFLKNESYKFSLLLDLTCVDYCPQKPRFEIIYHVFSLENNQRLRIKTRLPEEDLHIDSLTALWKNANWLEREVYDMFGVCFDGHPDLRRLFMYDGFEGYPLRKDYPLRKRQPRIPLRE